MVARPHKLDHPAGELGGTAGQGKQGAGLAIALPERNRFCALEMRDYMLPCLFLLLVLFSLKKYIVHYVI